MSPPATFDVAWTSSAQRRRSRRQLRRVDPDGLAMLIGEAGGTIPFGFDHVPIEAWLTTMAWGSADDLRDVVRLAEKGRVSWSTERVPLGGRAGGASATSGRRDVDGRLVLVPGARRRAGLAPEEAGDEALALFCSRVEGRRGGVVHVAQGRRAKVRDREEAP